MLRRSAVQYSHLGNIARGLGKVAAACCPFGGGAPSSCFSSLLPSPLSSSSSSGPQAFRTQYTDTSARAMALSPELVAQLSPDEYQKSKRMRHRAVPATRTVRALGFTSLFLQLGYGKLFHSGATPAGGVFSTQEYGNIVETLCRMRGAVLKLGQMLSIQDENTIPSRVTALFETVRDNAFAMPVEQLSRTLSAEWGDAEWREHLFEFFDENPIAAASIGQVHYARLRTPETGGAREVAVKVQYPGVAQSIGSDVANLKMLMSLNILPRGMFVDSILKELQAELTLECKYRVEGAKQARYKRLIEADADLSSVFRVPEVIAALNTDQVLVSEFVRGIPIDQIAKRSDVPQAFRDRIADMLMLLTLRELFQWQFMQTDPNFANYLFDAHQGKVHLLDFGAAREYSDAFISDYLDVVAAAGRGDRETIVQKSIDLGFLTGREVAEMVDAHVASVLLLGRCFASDTEPYDFSRENIPQMIQAHVPTMIKLRLKPPPTPVYSLHRRLSGTILIATKLRATVNSGPQFWRIYEQERERLHSSAAKAAAAEAAAASSKP